MSSTAYTEAATEALMDNEKLNPVRTEENGEVHLTLVFRGVDFDPGALFDALQNLGTVSTDFLPTRSNYNFVITP